MLRIALSDHQPLDGKRKDRLSIIGQTIISLSELRGGYRYITLQDEQLYPVLDTRIHVFIHTEKLSSIDQRGQAADPGTAAEPCSVAAVLSVIITSCFLEVRSHDHSFSNSTAAKTPTKCPQAYPFAHF